jgi:hypothetical protein
MNILLSLISDLLEFIGAALQLVLFAGLLIAVAVAAELVHLLHERMKKHRAGPTSKPLHGAHA